VIGDVQLSINNEDDEEEEEEKDLKSSCNGPNDTTPM
jgi:hypothetical protein